MGKFQISLFVFLFCMSGSMLAGGGWTQKKAGLYLKASQWWTTADEHFTDVGEIDPNATLGIFNSSIYAEYGVTDRFTAVLYFPFFSRATINNQVSGTTGETITEGDGINSLGDTDITLKYGLTPNSQIKVAASLLFGLPLGTEQGGNQDNLQTGDGEFNQMLRLDAGTSFKIGSVPSFANVYGGYNNRSKGFSDEIRFGAELGFNLIESHLWLIGRLNVVESRKNGTLATSSSSSTIFSNNTEFTSFGFEAAYQFGPKFGISASMEGASSGELILASPSYSVGVFMNI